MVVAVFNHVYEVFLFIQTLIPILKDITVICRSVIFNVIYLKYVAGKTRTIFNVRERRDFLSKILFNYLLKTYTCQLYLIT